MMVKRIANYVYELQENNSIAVIYLGLEDHIQRTLHVKMKLESISDYTGKFVNLQYDSINYTAPVFNVTESNLISVLSH